MTIGTACRILIACVGRSWLVAIVTWCSMVIVGELWRNPTRLRHQDAWTGLLELAFYVGMVALPFAIIGGFVAILLAWRKQLPWNRRLWTAAGALTGILLPGTLIFLLGPLGEGDAAAVILVLTTTGLFTGAVVASSLADWLETIWLDRRNELTAKRAVADR